MASDDKGVKTDRHAPGKRAARTPRTTGRADACHGDDPRPPRCDRPRRADPDPSKDPPVPWAPLSPGGPSQDQGRMRRRRLGAVVTVTTIALIAPAATAGDAPRQPAAVPVGRRGRRKS